MNYFQKYDSSKLTGISLNYNDMNVQVFLKLYVLLYADDTLLFSETAKGMQNANATLSYCEETIWA